MTIDDMPRTCGNCSHWERIEGARTGYGLCHKRVGTKQEYRHDNWLNCPLFKQVGAEVSNDH